MNWAGVSAMSVQHKVRENDFGDIFLVPLAPAVCGGDFAAAIRGRKVCWNRGNSPGIRAPQAEGYMIIRNRKWVRAGCGPWTWQPHEHPEPRSRQTIFLAQGDADIFGVVFLLIGLGIASVVGLGWLGWNALQKAIATPREVHRTRISDEQAIVDMLMERDMAATDAATTGSASMSEVALGILTEVLAGGSTSVPWRTTRAVRRGLSGLVQQAWVSVSDTSVRAA